MKKNIFPYRAALSLVVWLAVAGVCKMQAQPKFSQPHGLYDLSSLSVAITTDDTEATIHYTLDGSDPSPKSPRYTSPLTLSKTTLLRAAEVKGDTLSSPIATATYIFMASVLSQPDNPEGYPTTWGKYTDIQGVAPADYGMDSEMTGDSKLRPKIIEGLKSLPILSIVSDKDNFFSHEEDPDRGGIYIFTGPPVGDPTGHGWTRPASVELFGGPQQHDMSINCGVRLHGGHGRLAEKNPKHSFRLVFKKEYGAGTLNYPLFGENEPDKFDQLVLRCHFGNAWQHWGEDNRQRAQYTRDVWARRMQRRMGHTSANALYVHVFLNGMYWGLYNIAERVDDTFGKNHLGGKKADIDVIKVEEDGGNHIEASEGDLEAWELMVQTAAAVGSAATDANYLKLQGKDANGNDDPEQEALLDIDNFIDYMLINQYGGNSDWDHHNWYAIRRKGEESQGFRFLCWDSEIIFVNEYEDVVGRNNGNRYPTGIFNNLLRNTDFALRYLKRAKEVLADDGFLGSKSVVEVWDSLYHTIQTAIYDESARWGDYRRDVHPYTSRGKLYTVDNFYLPERDRLLTQYFPYRTDYVLDCITSYVAVDDFEAPEDWTLLTADMFQEWNNPDTATPTPTGRSVDVTWNLGANTPGGAAVAGFVNVEYNRFADLTGYGDLVLRGSGYGLRILANRLVDHGPHKEITVSFDEWDPYWDAEIHAIVLPLKDLMNVSTNKGDIRNDEFLHLHALKVEWNSTAKVTSAYLTPGQGIATILNPKVNMKDNGQLYNLNGQPVSHPVKGIYIQNGKKIIK